MTAALFRRDGQPYARDRTVLVELGRRSAWLTGPRRGIVAACKAVGAPWMRPVPTGSATATVPLDYAADVVAYLEHVQRRRVDVVEVDR